MEKETVYFKPSIRCKHIRDYLVDHGMKMLYYGDITDSVVYSNVEETIFVGAEVLGYSYIAYAKEYRHLVVMLKLTL